MQTQRRTATRRPATPARWQAALGRARAEGVTLYELSGSGAWVATSGTDPQTAYELEIVGGVARGCGCEAGAHGDPVRKHRAAFYHAAGLLDPVDVPAGACPGCEGAGFRQRVSATFHGVSYRTTCRACRGSGAAPTQRPAA